MRRLFAFIIASSLLSWSLYAAEEAKFFGKGYFSYFHNLSSDKGVGSGQTNAFELTRLYFGYDRDLSDQFSIRFLLDADYAKEYALTETETTIGEFVSADSDTVAIPVYTYELKESKKSLRPFLKNAYLAMNFKLIKGSKWYFGMIGMPFVSVPESHWGYRSIYKMAMDVSGIEWGSTADLGIGWKGMWWDMVQVEFALANGAGYKSPEADMFKLLELRPTAYLLQKALTLSAFASYETYSQDVDDVTLALMAGYDHKLFKIAGEYSTRTRMDYVLDTSGRRSNLSQNNLSLWGHLKPTEKITILGRYDIYEPDADQDQDKSSTAIVGVDFHPLKNVHFIPNLQMRTFEMEDDPSTTSIDESSPITTAYVTLEYGW